MWIFDLLQIFGVYSHQHRLSLQFDAFEHIKCLYKYQIKSIVENAHDFIENGRYKRRKI